MIQRLLITGLLVITFLSAWNQVRPLGKVPKTASLETVIRNELDKALEKYRYEESNETIWKQMRSDADNILFAYFQKGKLFGTSKSQAYYIKIGPETITATDIKKQRKILIAGIAIQKPAEFIQIIIEK